MFSVGSEQKRGSGAPAGVSAGDRSFLVVKWTSTQAHGMGCPREMNLKFIQQRADDQTTCHSPATIWRDGSRPLPPFPFPGCQHTRRSHRTPLFTNPLVSNPVSIPVPYICTYIRSTYFLDDVVSYSECPKIETSCECTEQKKAKKTDTYSTNLEFPSCAR